ncbi:hypothetical protein KSS87_022589 [Heliosperma pusillum]|nr:hypothetical protein KSS87_022589 [Heliosperma pusillum]
MAVSSTWVARVLPSVECRREPKFSANLSPDFPGSSRRRSHSSIPNRGGSPSSFTGLSSSLILRFPPNFVRQLSTKARRNCSNIGVAQIVAASWTDNNPDLGGVPAVNAVDSAAVLSPVDDEIIVDGADYNNANVIADVHSSNNADCGGQVVQAGGGGGGEEEGRHTSYEYGRYGNPTSTVLEEKISALERAESTMLLASGMCASVLMMIALVPKGGHIVTTTDCYRKTRMFIEKTLPTMQITATVIDPADVEGLKTALEENNVSVLNEDRFLVGDAWFGVDLFFTESPTNPFLRCVDIKLVSELCHKKGALVCIDGTFSTSFNQKALPLGADLVVHSMTKYMGGHNDVLGGCISGAEKLISKIRYEHHIFGGTLNPNASYMIIRGMKTMHLRVQQQNATAMRMAEILEAHPKIARVYYPGLASHPEHELAKRQMIGFGGVVSFELDGDLETTIKFTDALKIPYIAPSFGGCESIVDPPAIMSYWDLSPSDRLKYGIKDTLIRFSFGVEDFEDLKADILQALESI